MAKAVVKTQPGVGGAGPRSFGGTLPVKVKPGGPSQSNVRTSSGGRDYSDVKPPPKGNKKKSKFSEADDQRKTTPVPKKPTLWERLEETPAPDLPGFTPDYGVQAAPTQVTGVGLRSLIGMKQGSSIAPVGGNPLHYQTHKAGQKVPKSGTSKLSSKRASKSTCHYKGK